MSELREFGIAVLTGVVAGVLIVAADVTVLLMFGDGRITPRDGGLFALGAFCGCWLGRDVTRRNRS